MKNKNLFYFNAKGNLISQIRSISAFHNACYKAVSHPMKSVPLVSDVERGWCEWWKQNDYFKHTSSSEKFSMILPPPNVTGKLHMGHAVTCALQDAIVRWNHMSGKCVVWIPGCDHAGIATQVVVERHLWKTRGLTRHDLGRQKFIAEVESWKEEKEAAIYEQMQRLGVMLDWEKSFFTLDSKIRDGVIEAFIRLFDSGLAFRGMRMVNWCSALQSAIADWEVEKVDVDGPTDIVVPGHDKPVTFGYIYDVKYQISDSDECVTVCTTRPETILGDTALVVHPEDPRYHHLRGKQARHPFSQEAIPIVEDTSVDREFGSGVVKVTPGHSFQDFDVAKIHDLPVVDILDDRGWINVNGFENQPRFYAREEVLNRLANMGLLMGKKPHSLQLPRCMRSGDIIEPRLKVQWFLSGSEMSSEALKAVQNGDLKLHPPGYSGVWENFLSEGRDWCISRQLWWGHRIPVYWASKIPGSSYGNEKEIKDGDSLFVAAKSKEEAKSKAAERLAVKEEEIISLQQEEDVLDTWFSSSVLPFVVFGWPHKNPEFEKIFPLSLMETGHDILFFWVARMVMMSLQLTKTLPFKDVLLHGIVCDADGQKMSKSKGNVIDPLDIIDGINNSKSADDNNLKLAGNKSVSKEGFGADALRFALCSLDLTKQNVSLDLRAVQQNNFFRNKIWQACRFLRHHRETIPESLQAMQAPSSGSLSNLMDRWICSQLAHMVRTSHCGFMAHNVHEAAQAIARFWQSSFCDIYLESCKPRLWRHETSSEDAATCLSIIWLSIEVGLRGLVPFMPFLSEELYQYLPSILPKNKSIMQCSYPHPDQYDCFSDPVLDDHMDTALLAASAIRSLRKQYNITSKKPQGTASIVIESNNNLKSSMEGVTEALERLCFLERLSVYTSEEKSSCTSLEVNSSGIAVQPVVPGVTAQLHLKGLVDPVIELERLERKLHKLQKEATPIRSSAERRQAKGKDLLPKDANKLQILDSEILRIEKLMEDVRKLL